MIYYAYALDESEHLMGVLSFRELLSAERSRKVRDVMRTNYVFVLEDADQETVAQLLAKHRLLAVPVLDPEGHMLGIVTSADVAGLVQQEAGEDILKIGGMEALDGPYLEVTFGADGAQARRMAGHSLCRRNVDRDRHGFLFRRNRACRRLALFIPLIISSGGNSGSQATTLVIRRHGVGRNSTARLVARHSARAGGWSYLGNHPRRHRDLTDFPLARLARDIRAALYVVVALTIGCSLVGVVMFGTTAGSMLPFILRRCGLDPASASAPFVATWWTSPGSIIYFSVASVILEGILL